MMSTLSAVAAPAFCRPAAPGRAAKARAFVAPQPHRSCTPRVQRARRRDTVVVAASGAGAAAAEHLQLATARLPADVNRDMFNEAMFQWASTLVQNGINLPFALPLKCDRLADGFQISLLRVADGGRVVSVGDLRGSIEAVPGAGDVLIVRFFEGEGAAEVGMGGPRGAPQLQRLETLLSSLIDVSTIMNTMPGAIKRSIMVSR